MLILNAESAVVRGLAPDRQSECDFHIRIRTLEYFQNHGPAYKFWNAEIYLNAALLDPVAIFYDLKREGYENAFCYCGLPQQEIVPVERPDYAEPPDLSYVPWDKRYVAAVYVVPHQDEYLVLDWEPREACESDIGHPEDWGQDFRGRRWHRH